MTLLFITDSPDQPCPFQQRATFFLTCLIGCKQSQTASQDPTDVSNTHGLSAPIPTPPGKTRGGFVFFFIGGCNLPWRHAGMRLRKEEGRLHFCYGREVICYFISPGRSFCLLSPTQNICFCFGSGFLTTYCRLCTRWWQIKGKTNMKFLTVQSGPHKPPEQPQCCKSVELCLRDGLLHKISPQLYIQRLFNQVRAADRKKSKHSQT